MTLIYKLILKISLAMIFILLIFHFVPIREITILFREIKIASFLYAIGLFPIFILLKSIKWYVLVCDEIKSRKFLPVVKSLLIGMSIALITPMRLGELTRALWLDSDKKTYLSGLVIVDKVIDVVTLIIFSSLIIYLYTPIKSIIMISFFAVFCLLILYNGKRSSIVIRKIIHSFPYLPFKDKLLMLVECLSQITRTKITCIFILTFATFFVVILQGHLLTLSFDCIAFKFSFIAWPLIILTNLLPITFGGIGPREAAAVLLLSKMFGISKAAAISSSLTLFFINSLIPGIIGIFLYILSTKTQKFRNSN